MLQEVGTQLDVAVAAVREQLAQAGVKETPESAARLRAHAAQLTAIDPARFSGPGLGGTSPFEERGRP